MFDLIKDEYLLNSLDEAVLIVNKNMEIIYSNSSIVKYFDLQKNEDLLFIKGTLVKLCESKIKCEFKIDYNNTLLRIRFSKDTNGSICFIISEEKIISDSGILIDELLKAIIDNTFNSILITDNDIQNGPKITFVNKSFTSLTGYSQEEVLGKHPRLLFGDKSELKEKDNIYKYLNGSIPKYKGIITNYKKNGAQYISETSILPVYDKLNKITHHISIQNDITTNVTEKEKLKELKENLEKSNQNLQQFAYSASHDLQEPVRIITNYLELIELKYLDNLDDNGKRYINYVLNSSKRIRKLINDLLDFSRVNSKIINRNLVDLNKIIDEVLETYKYKIREKNIKIEIEKLPKLYLDDSLIYQLFMNLIGNAIKFSRDDVDSLITIKSQVEKNSQCIIIKDNGIGIKNENKELIFELFKKIHLRSEYDGTGIGLSICKSIVETHGGRISVDSQFGKWSKFKVKFPIISL